MVHPATQHAVKAASWWARTRDMPEVLLLYGWLGFAAGMGIYSAKRVYFNSEAGSYVNINMRGDPMAQVQTAEVGLQDAAKGKHSLFWHIAQFKVDEDGANVGVFDNRTRPHQYSKPGAAGVGAGVPQ
ncbi:MAG: hypothetical protein J3K34DRAFT_527839 [Monoraphidium minutum]|nr:MAG: hypothetical protein J3K34DRAFT_527839 [Monoraphidium minutum]